MEHDREYENRSGHPGGDAPDKRKNADAGFEGMNYEQRRQPYFKTPQKGNRFEQPSGPATDNVDDRSPI